MQKYQSDQYKKIFEKLPKEIQDAILSNDTVQKMIKIGYDHKLQIDQIGVLQDIILDVMMGITAGKNFVEELSQELKIQTVDASAISRDVDEQIFKPIKELMVKIYDDGAPYKLSTLKTADEKEEDISNLHPHEILREIENPVAHEVKNIIITPKKAGDSSFVPTTSKTIEEYHTEISLGKMVSTPEVKKPDFRSSSPTGISNLEESKKRLLDSIATQKLSSVFTMPRTKEENIPTEQKNTFSAQKDQKTLESSKEQGTRLDPYRESIK